MPPPPSEKARTRSHSDFVALEDKLDTIIADISTIKADSTSIKQDINLIKGEIRQFKEDVTKSLDMCFEQVNDLKKAIDETNSKVVLQKETIDAFKNENLQLKQQLLALKNRLNSAEQYSRSNCLDIQGVPETKSENILDVVTKVGQAVGFKLEPSMVDAVHRLSPNSNKPDAPRGIIVKFCRRLDMEEMRRKAIRKKGFSASNLGLPSNHTVYVNLSMTRETRILWSETRKFKAENNYRFAWVTSSGKIFLRKSEGEHAILVEDLSDLKRLKPAQTTKS